MSHNLIIGGVIITAHEALDIGQDYFPVGPQKLLRFADGGSLMQSVYNKIGISISGTGVMPPALDGLDFDSPMLISCIKSKKKAGVGASSIIGGIPTAIRSEPEFVPRGYAIVNNKPIETTVSIAAGFATLGTVTGATQYHVDYYPEVLCQVFRPTSSLRTSSAQYTWQLTAEEK